jgi:hypothetical protein
VTNILNDLIVEIAQKKQANKSDYVYKDEEIKAFTKSCWDLIPGIEALDKEKFSKLAFDINRALHSFPDDLNGALSNFKSLNLSNTSTQKPLFANATFMNTLKASHAVFQGKYAAANIQAQLATNILQNVTERQQEDLFKVTAKILIGVITSKGLSRSVDNSMMSNANDFDPSEFQSI